MKHIDLELPDALARELDGVVQAGWFSSDAEVVRQAVREFLRRQRFELLERQQMADIEWALRQRPEPPSQPGADDRLRRPQA
jgi:Arc/MetJ-type ribon-helix-helix transcriptional regulator